MPCPDLLLNGTNWSQKTVAWLGCGRATCSGVLRGSQGNYEDIARARFSMATMLTVSWDAVLVVGGVRWPYHSPWKRLV